MPGRVGRPKAYDRGDVLRRAMELFWAKGYEGAHLGELVQVTGLNRFSLYQEFGGKDGIFREALDLYLAEAGAAYEETLGREPLGLDNIRDYFASIRFPRGYHGCFMINTLTEKHIVSDAAFQAAKRYAKRAERLFLANVRAAQQRGEIDPGRDAEALAGLLATLDQGLAVHGIVSPSNRAKNEIVAQLETVLAPAPRAARTGTWGTPG